MPALLPRGCLAGELRAQLVEPAAGVLILALPLTSCQQRTVPPSTVHSNFLFSWSPSSEGDDSAIRHCCSHTNPWDASFCLPTDIHPRLGFLCDNGKVPREKGPDWSLVKYGAPCNLLTVLAPAEKPQLTCVEGTPFWLLRYFLFRLFCLAVIYLCKCMWVHATVSVWRSVDNLHSWFSLSTGWVPGIKLQASVLAAITCAHLAVLPPLTSGHFLNA